MKFAWSTVTTGMENVALKALLKAFFTLLNIFFSKGNPVPLIQMNKKDKTYGE